jgi:hypothetical protein
MHIFPFLSKKKLLSSMSDWVKKLDSPLKLIFFGLWRGGTHSRA